MAEVDVVNVFTIDYMHAVLLGVMKQILTFWITDRKKDYSLSNEEIEEMSSRLKLLYSQHPREFPRRPRDLSNFKRFKATELRQLLLYTLPIVAKGIVKDNYYEHILKLHCGIRMLCDVNHFKGNCTNASKLLKDFVEEYSELYGPEHVSYNVHCLLHLHTDVLHLQAPLDSFSCFKFENYLQTVKNLPKGGYRVLEQVRNRLVESQLVDTTHIVSSPIIKMRKGAIISAKVNDLYLSTVPPNNFCGMRGSKTVHQIQKFFIENDVIYCELKEVENLSSIYETPVPSQRLKLYVSSSNSIETKDCVLSCSIFEIQRKFCYFKLNDKEYLLRLLH